MFAAMSIRYALAVLIVTVPAQASSAYGAGWAAVHADSANSNYAATPGPQSLHLAWERQFGGLTTLGVSTAPSGRIFLTTAAPGCHLYALDPETGKTLWCSEKIGRLAVLSGPLLDSEGRIFVPDNDAMYAFRRDGALLWRQPIDGVPLSAQFTPGGRLVFITAKGSVHILDRGTGRPVMETLMLAPDSTFDPEKDVMACAKGEAACPSANTPAVDPASGRLFFTFWSPGAAKAGVRAMTIHEGAKTRLSPLWTADILEGGSGSSPVLSADGKRVYVTDNGGRLLALEAENGAIAWQYGLGYAAGGAVSVSPDGIIMPAGGGSAPVTAIRDGGSKPNVLWQRQDLQNRGIATQAAGGTAYVTVAASRHQTALHILNTATGHTEDSAALPGRTFFSVGTTVGPGAQVYVSTIGGHLFAFREPHTGR